jgi:hypothetical protein
LKGSLFSPDPDREGNVITAEGNPCPNVFCDGPSQSVPIPHFVTARHKQTCPILFLPSSPVATSAAFITQPQPHHPAKNVIGDIHEPVDSLGVPVAFLKIESSIFSWTPSPCAVRATNRAAVAAGATSDNRRQKICRNLPPPTIGNCRR